MSYLLYVQDYPLSEVLSAHYIHSQYKPELITMVLDKLLPTNMRLA